MNSSEPTNDPELTQWESKLQAIQIPGIPRQRDELFYEAGYAVATAETVALKRSIILWRSGCLAAAAAVLATATLTLRPPNDPIATPNTVIETSKSLAVDARTEQSLMFPLQGERTSQPAAHSLIALSQQLGQVTPPQRPRMPHLDANVVGQPMMNSGDIAWAMKEI